MSQKPPFHPIAETGVVFALAAGALLFVAGMAACLSTPTVERHWPDGACVAVHPPSAGTCDAMPARYDTVWVGGEGEGR